MVFGKKELVVAFHRFDVDGDGMISPTELCMCMRTVGHDLPLEDVEELVVAIDSDGDGLLGFEDFVSLVEVEGGEEGDVELRQAFDLYKMEGVGCITASSLRDALGMLGKVRDMEECEVMIRKFDVDGDGMISFDEFRVMMFG